MTDRVSPAQEHFASALVIKKILVATDGVEKSASEEDARKVLLFAPEGEHHEIPIFFMQYLLKKNGVSHIYAGKNTADRGAEGYLSATRDYTTSLPPGDKPVVYRSQCIPWQNF